MSRRGPGPTGPGPAPAPSARIAHSTSSSRIVRGPFVISGALLTPTDPPGQRAVRSSSAATSSIAALISSPLTRSPSQTASSASRRSATSSRVASMFHSASVGIPPARRSSITRDRQESDGLAGIHRPSGSRRPLRIVRTGPHRDGRRTDGRPARRSPRRTGAPGRSHRERPVALVAVSRAPSVCTCSGPSSLALSPSRDTGEFQRSGGISGAVETRPGPPGEPLPQRDDHFGSAVRPLRSGDRPRQPLDQPFGPPRRGHHGREIERGVEVPRVERPAQRLLRGPELAALVGRPGDRDRVGGRHELGDRPPDAGGDGGPAQGVVVGVRKVVEGQTTVPSGRGPAGCSSSAAAGSPSRAPPPTTPAGPPSEGRPRGSSLRSVSGTTGILPGVHRRTHQRALVALRPRARGRQSWKVGWPRNGRGSSLQQRESGVPGGRSREILLAQGDRTLGSRARTAS